MNSSLWFMFAIAIAIVQSKQLDAGPQSFIDKTPAETKLQKRQTEEIVVYLTPSQIKSLQEGKGYVDSEPIEQPEASQEEQEEAEQSQQEDDGFQLGSLDLDAQTEEENNQLPPSIPVEEPTSEELDELQQFSWLYRPPQDRQFVPSSEDNFAYLRSYPEIEAQTEAAQLESEESEEESEEAQPEIPQQRYRLVPYDTTESPPTTTKAPQEEPIRERWLRLLEQNRAQLRKAQENAAATISTTEQPQVNPDSTLSRLRFSARYNDQKQAIENEERIKSIIEKQRALIRAEARANNAPVSKEAKITKQAPVIRHVKVHTPVLVPIPEPFEVKVPHPFPVPFDLFRSLSAQASNTKKAEPKKAEAKKPASARAEEKPKASPKKPSPPAEKPKPERRAPADPKKEVTIEVPSRQRSQPERITIIRHIFEK